MFALPYTHIFSSWRWAYGIGSLYGAIVVFFITFFMEETWVPVLASLPTLTSCIFYSPDLYSCRLGRRRLYDRTLLNPRPIPLPRSRVLRRVEALIGITGLRMARYRASWRETILACVNIVWRPQLLGILLFEVSDSYEPCKAS